MKNVFFDLRGHGLRVLVADGETTSYLQRFEKFALDDAVSADQILSEISAKAGVKLDKIHCIMPSEDVSLTTLTIPAMSLSDAEKVIKRKLIKETGNSAPIFSIIPLRTAGDKQPYIVESVTFDTLKRYVNFFRERKITVKSFTSALPANLRAIKNINNEPGQTLALLDIGNDIIEMTVISDHVISYGKATILPLDVEKELQSGKTPERIQKMRVYRIVESVYNAQTDYKKDYPNDPIRKMLVCGAENSLGGVLEALTESLNIETHSLNTFKESVADAFQYTALHGFALGIQDHTAANYLPRELSRTMPLYAYGKSALVTAACIFALLIATAVSILETKYRSAEKLLGDRIRASQLNALDPDESSSYVKQSASLKGLIAKQVSWYALFGYLADNTPEGMYLEGISLKQRAGGSLLDIGFVTPSYAEIGGNRFLTRIIAMIDSSGFLRRIGEPTITITKQDNSKLLHFMVSCEVLSFEKAK